VGPSGFKTHVVFELCDMGFEGFHFLMEVRGLCCQLRILRQVRDTFRETPDNNYAISEIVRGLHQNRFLPVAGCHELLDEFGPSHDGADKLSYNLEVFESSFEIGAPSGPESTIKAPISLSAASSDRRRPGG